MKIRLRKTLAFVMAAVMALSAFSFSSFAASPDEFDDIQTITSESFDVTILRNSHSMYYKFVPTSTAYYYVYTDGVSETWLTFYDDEFYEIKQTYSMEYEGGCSGSMLYLTAGSTYYIEISVYSESYPVTFAFNLRCLGTLDNAEITWLPGKLTYISGYDTEWFDFGGMDMSLTFSGGSVLRPHGYEVSDLFDYSYPEDVIGTNTMTLSLMGQFIASFEYEVIENPVSSIEIVRAPYKEYYRYARDGYFNLEDWFFGWFVPDIDTEGLKVKINYTDGTSKTVEYGEDDDFVFFEDEGEGMYVDDYFMEVYSDGGYDCGDYNATVYYLGHEASFTIKVVDISLFEKLYVCAYELIDWMLRFIITF